MLGIPAATVRAVLTVADPAKRLYRFDDEIACRPSRSGRAVATNRSCYTVGPETETTVNLSMRPCANRARNSNAQLCVFILMTLRSHSSSTDTAAHANDYVYVPPSFLISFFCVLYEQLARVHEHSAFIKQITVRNLC